MCFVNSANGLKSLFSGENVLLSATTLFFTNDKIKKLKNSPFHPLLY